MHFRPGYLSDQFWINGIHGPVPDVRSFNLFLYLLLVTDLIFFIPLFITLEYIPNSFIFLYITFGIAVYCNVYIRGFS